MHRNTALLLVILAAIAFLLIGFNLGRRFVSPTQIAEASPLPEATLVPVPSPFVEPVITTTSYTLKSCEIGFAYESDYLLKESTRAAVLTNKETQETINIACAGEIPRPPLPKDRIEETTIGELTVNLYHDASARDGAPLDAVIFTHPKTGLDLAILGFGEAYNRLLKTVQLLP